tara:strand:- start:264 stop:488 length:225 start_codon:yes stop_codon:yes gene_type:complete
VQICKISAQRKVGTMKTEKEIRSEIVYMKEGVEQCDSPDEYICQGWVEALKWVLLPSPISIDEYMQQHKKIIEG